MQLDPALLAAVCKVLDNMATVCLWAGAQLQAAELALPGIFIRGCSSPHCPQHWVTAPRLLACSYLQAKWRDLTPPHQILACTASRQCWQRTPPRPLSPRCMWLYRGSSLYRPPHIASQVFSSHRRRLRGAGSCSALPGWSSRCHNYRSGSNGSSGLRWGSEVAPGAGAPA